MIELSALTPPGGPGDASLAATLAPYLHGNARVEATGRSTADRMPRRVHAVLRLAIRDLRLHPGRMILEREVVEATGISRTPVREALVRLEAEGLVRLVPRHGFAVAPLAAEDMRQIYEVVEGLETVAVALAAERADGAGVAALDASIVRQEAALAADDLLAWIAADELFHHHILELSGNPRLQRLAAHYDDHLHRARLSTIRRRPRPVRSTAEHRAVVEAIRMGNGRAARELHQTHRQRARGEIVAILRATERNPPGGRPTGATGPTEGAER